MPEILFPLPRGNQLSIKLAKHVTRAEFDLILKAVDFVKWGLIEVESADGAPTDAICFACGGPPFTCPCHTKPTLHAGKAQLEVPNADG